ncbi:DUF2969 family protein [Weissella muntiaci]|jgi:Protein of unknown function (DUF2969).|uniref:DUF2969 family protein n=1 Tax=Weissella muntiaci TaxID=2508881 RepID=A0A6C2CA55_9LACO|nr:DUF2969 family protein [Weissella muntiaci]TYC50283.1 DUF2969 family protein [Weissella muntiaci]
MARSNKPVAVEINDLGDNLNEVMVNKVRLGTIDETKTPLQVRYADNRTTNAKSFDEAVSLLIAEYNLHH